MAAVRTCIVSVRDTDGLTHMVSVQGATLYEAAVAAIDAFRQQAGAATALTPNAVLSIEVRVPAIVHKVPIQAVERWQRSPSSSPKELLSKRER